MYRFFCEKNAELLKYILIPTDAEKNLIDSAMCSIDSKILMLDKTNHNWR